jgi:hypothetical protein
MGSAAAVGEPMELGGAISRDTPRASETYPNPAAEPLTRWGRALFKLGRRWVRYRCGFIDAGQNG